MARVLTEGGYDVHLASNGDEAVAMIDQLGAKLRAVVSDFPVARNGGQDVVEYLRHVAPNAAIVLTTPGTESFDPDVMVLDKQVPPADLLRTVAEAISRNPTGSRASSPARLRLPPAEVTLDWRHPGNDRASGESSH
jgi:CheY-like chemotaxis protein